MLIIFRVLLLMTAAAAITACGLDNGAALAQTATSYRTDNGMADGNDRYKTRKDNESGKHETDEGGDKMKRNIIIRVGGQRFTATLEDNATARAFHDLLPMTVTMNEMNGNEKYCDLDETLPTDTFRPGNIRTGDLLLWGTNTLVLFYKTFSSTYSYTRLGRIDAPSELLPAIGRGDVTVIFEAADK